MFNPFSLADKTVLVTGASSGIGKAIAIVSSKMGARVVITGRNRQRLDETLVQLHGKGHKAIIADLSRQEEIKLLIDEVPELDGIVNCAGLTIPKPFKFYSNEDAEKVMQVNFFAPMIITRDLVKSKKLKKGSSIVFISSINGLWVSSSGGSLYAASKGAVNGLCKTLAIELAPHIRVNTVNPGMVNTGIYDSGIVTKEQLQEDAKKYPLKRYGEPEEIANAVVFLLSDASSFMTGSHLLIDGGFTLQ